MQAVKDKLTDMKELRKVKAEAKAEEKAEKDLAKARVDVAHEVRLAKEAEATMEIHVAKAGRRVERELEKHAVSNQTPQSTTDQPPNIGFANDPYGPNPTHPGGPTATTANTMATGNTANYTAGAPPRNNYM